MTIEQDLLLSDYFDGHLDPDQRLRAEAILASDPSAVEALRSLTGVRDLVAALSRPHSPDVSGLVLDRIAADAGRLRPWKTWGPYLGRALGASAIAASLGLVVFLGAESRLLGPSPPPPARILEKSGAPATLAARPPVPATVQPIAEAAAPKVAQSPPPGPADLTPAPIIAAAEPPPARPDQPPGFQELWAAAGPRRDFIVTSAPDESTTATVATLLGLSSHRDFFKVVLPAGPGAAADESGSAVAFAARLDPSEYTTLRGRLEARFRNRMVIGDSEPEATALLADVGQVTASPATPAAEVSFPQTQHAFRIRSDGSSQPRAETDASTEPPSDAPVPPPPADPIGPSVVLIWIVGPVPK